MRRLTLPLILVAIGAIGCSDAPTQPGTTSDQALADERTEPYQVFQATPDVPVAEPSVKFQANLVSAPAAAPATALEDLVSELFPPPGLSRAASVQLRNIWRDVLRGNGAEALVKARYFLAFTLAKFENGQLADPNGAAPPSTATAVALLLNGVFEFVGVPGGQVVSLSRDVYGSPLIDAVALGKFPRGGSYLATVSGVGVENASGIVVNDANVYGNVVGSPGPGLLTVMIGSYPVGPGETALAPISDVPFLLTTDLGGAAPLVIGNGTFDIVKGPKPIATALNIVGPVTELPRGQSTAIDFSLDVTSAGNLKYLFVGCALCAVDFTGFGGDQFEHNMTFTVTWDVAIDYGWPDFGLGSGGVNGSDEEGRLEISIPVVGP